jgi:hypothetical protein
VNRWHRFVVNNWLRSSSSAPKRSPNRPRIARVSRPLQVRRASTIELARDPLERNATLVMPFRQHHWQHSFETGTSRQSIPDRPCLARVVAVDVVGADDIDMPVGNPLPEHIAILAAQRRVDLADIAAPPILIVRDGVRTSFHGGREPRFHRKFNEFNRARSGNHSLITVNHKLATFCELFDCNRR